MANVVITKEYDPQSDLLTLQGWIGVLNKNTRFTLTVEDGDVDDVYCLLIDGENVLVNVDLDMIMGYVLGMSFVLDNGS